ncbi:cysteine desulfurase NifS [Patescibacteria group bacterium]|nr:cysteine desulfurase NifS [Patescibacteria group bacterium]MBU1890449.1 cysteine desulfurase NifS [Patescibacteria group bacterium]
MKKVYLDYAATTPMDARVVKAMTPYFRDKFGNSVSLHSYGQEANIALTKSREKIARALSAKPEEIIFTGSATESNNLAIKGVILANKDKGRHVIVSSIEHHCVLNSAKWLAKQGYRVTYLPVDKTGLVSSAEVKKAIKKDTVLVSIMHANTEIGTIQPIEAIGQICRQKKVYFHTDAVQSFGKIPINVEKMKIDLLAASSHKMCGPKGTALLYKRQGVRLEPLFHGGGHESDLRPSTVNVPAIVGFAKAVEICHKEMTKEQKRLTSLRNKLIKGILKKIPDSHLNGNVKKRLSNNVNIRFEYVEGEAIIMELDSYGIAASTASACSSAKLEPSHVLLAIGLKPQEAHGSLRFSLGKWTTNKDIDYVLEVLPKVIKKLRKISPFKKQ